MKSIALAVISALLLMSCAEYEEPRFDALDAGEISGARLWERISVESDYTRYEYWPGHDGLRLGQSPHGSFHRVFVNQDLLGALPAGDRTAPDGSIIVKENYNTDEELVAITVMAKVSEYDPENGDWFWVAYAPDGSIRAEGNLMSCISCHAGAAFNDYVIIGALNLPGGGGE